MAEFGDAHPHKLSFFIFSVLVTICLLLVTYIVATSNPYTRGDSQFGHNANNLKSESGRIQADIQGFAQSIHLPHNVSAKHLDMPPLNKSLHQGFAFLGSAAHSVATSVVYFVTGSLRITADATHSVGNIAVSAVNINTYIKSADRTPVPTIDPLPTMKVAIAPAPVAATVAKPAVPVQPDAKVKTIITTPTPQILSSNTYAWGNCTYWAAKRRAETNDPIPNTWGNADTWATRAARDGFTIDHHPSQGAIMQTPYSAGGLGHVAFVESVDQDGTWHISEMNVIGLDHTDYKTLPPSAATNYSFIHDKV